MVPTFDQLMNPTLPRFGRSAAARKLAEARWAKKT